MTSLIRNTFVLLTLALTLTACSTAEPPTGKPCDPYGGVIFVIGVSANQPLPDLTAEIGCRLEATIAASQPVGVISVDGAAHTLLPVRVYNVSANNPTLVQDAIDGAYNEVVLTVQNARPQADGSDLALGLNFAADAAATATDDVRSLVVIDSGLSDRGAGSMTPEGMTLASPDEFAAHLHSQGTFTETTFSGLSIELRSIGYSAGAQPPLSERQRESVARLWEGALTASGAEVEVVQFPREGSAPKTSFTAGVVEVVPEVELDPTAGAEYRFGDASALAFQPDLPTFKNKGAAEKELASLAEWLRAGSGRTATIVGHTSSARLSVSAQLSADRANTVKATLVELGVPIAALTARGDGYTASPPDRDSRNVLIPGAAARNRVVVISLDQR